MKKMLSAVLVLLSFSLPALAQEVGVVAGFRNDNADAASTNATVSSTTGFQAGILTKRELAGPLQLRTGFIYTSRTYGYSSPGSAVSGDFKVTYFEIPAGLLYKFSDYGGAFAGAALNLNLAKDCPGGSCSGADVATAPISVQFGGSFKFAPQMGFEVYYEMMTGNIAKDIKSVRSLVANLTLSFD